MYPYEPKLAIFGQFRVAKCNKKLILQAHNFLPTKPTGLKFSGMKLFIKVSKKIEFPVFQPFLKIHNGAFQNLFLLKKIDFHGKKAFSEVKIYKMALDMNPKSFGSDNILKILQENKKSWSLLFVYIRHYGMEIPVKM